MQIAYVVKLLTDSSVRDLIERFRQGSITDAMWSLAMDTVDRMENAGIELAIEGAFVVLIFEWIRSAVGSKQLLRVGPLRVKV
jgi:hypothetical protein